jgi:hypothetical protein
MSLNINTSCTKGYFILNNKLANIFKKLHSILQLSFSIMPNAVKYMLPMKFCILTEYICTKEIILNLHQCIFQR